MIDFLKGKVTPKDWAITGGIVAVTVLLCALFYVFVLTPQQAEITAVDGKLQEVKKQLQQAREIAKNIDQLRDEAKKWQQLVESFEERLPEEREIPVLLQKFESLGDQVGLRVELSQLPTIQDSRKETIPYKVVARGNFHQIANFINLLERDKRYLKISDLDIGAEEAGISQATFTLSTFRFLQTEKDLAAKAAAAAAAQGAAK